MKYGSRSLHFLNGHYAIAIAALNDLDMNQIIIEKDKAASVKYNHRTNLEQFIVDMRNKELDN